MFSQERWWSGFPMLRVLVALAAGIGMYEVLTPAPVMVVTVSCLALMIAGNAQIWRGRWLKRLSNWSVFPVFAGLGFLLMTVRVPQNSKNWDEVPPLAAAKFIAIISSEPAKKAGYSSMYVELKAVYTNNKWQVIHGKAWIQWAGDGQEGDRILINKPLKDIRIPGEDTSSFHLYLMRQKIFYRVKLNESDCLILFRQNNKSPVTYGRTYFRKVLKSHFPNPQTRSLAGAILYGEKNQLPQETTRAYIQTGVIHVIAISGMHLALIYTLIASLLKPLQRVRLKWLYTLACLSFLWVYAWICGSSPSVLRSAWMFSILLVGENFDKDKHTGNSLAASAVIMLCVNPLLVWDIGFQLSFSAVASLLIYQPMLQNLFKAENRLVSHGWGLVSTTLAAQILTTPLVIYHFGQFPLVFLVSNLLAVPVSSVVIVLLFITCLAYPLHLSAVPAKLAEILMHFMTSQIEALAHLPFANISHLQLSLPGLVNIYIVLIALTLWIRAKKR